MPLLTTDPPYLTKTARQVGRTKASPYAAGDCVSSRILHEEGGRCRFPNQLYHYLGCVSSAVAVPLLVRVCNSCRTTLTSTQSTPTLTFYSAPHIV